jgi:uncharacterized membrane protein
LEKHRLKVKLKIRFNSAILNYLRENFGAPFIVAFIVSLMLAASHLIENREALANEVAVYAYFFLVIGVLLQFLSSTLRFKIVRKA